MVQYETVELCFSSASLFISERAGVLSVRSWTRMASMRRGNGKFEVLSGCQGMLAK